MKLRNAISKYVTVSSEILGGTAVFKNTRVPIQILFDYLQGGDNLQEFLDNYPTVKEIYARRLLELSAIYLTKIEEGNEIVAG